MPQTPTGSSTRNGWKISLAPPTVKAVEVVESPPAPPQLPAGGRSFVVVHPRYRQWLAKCGLASPESFLALVGDVVCGHPDRHVARVELNAGVKPRVAFLKREHVVGRRTRWRNWRAGFGKVSRCEREAVTLKRLEDAGHPGPQWLAYGEAGGQAFLLVEELCGETDLRAYLNEYRLTMPDRRMLAERIGRALAELHEAGFGTPDLAAKHLFLRPDAMAVSLIDWQQTLPPGPIRFEDRYRWLGTLHATIAPELATPADRLRVLWAYRRAVLMARGTAKDIPTFAALVREVEHQARRVWNRSSVAAQRQPAPADDAPQRLRWLAGEAVVVTPDLIGLWPMPAVAPPYYPPMPTATPSAGHREWVTFEGRRAVLVRFHTVAPVGRLVAAVRERPWRSPGATAARVLFHLQRHGVPAPALLAFGQRTVSRTAAESFVVAEPSAGAVPLEHRLADPNMPAAERRLLLRERGRVLHQLHEAGCRPNAASANDPLLVSGPAGVAVGSPFAVRLARVTESGRLADLRQLLLPLGKTDRLRVLRGYLGDAWTDRAERQRWRRKVG